MINTPINLNIIWSSAVETENLNDTKLWVQETFMTYIHH